MVPETLRVALDSIATNSTNGASWLITQAAQAVRTALADDAALRSPESVGDVALAVARTRPDMAPFWNFANALALLVQDVSTSLPYEHLETTCAYFDSGSGVRIEKLAAEACVQFQSVDRVLTHSRSHSVERVLLRMHVHGGVRGVICTEGSPGMEGRALARVLAQAGIPVQFVTDSGAYTELDTVDVVLFGSDAVSDSGIRNKTGTLGLAAAANHLGIPVYGMFDSTKMLPMGMESLVVQLRRDGREVWDASPKGVEIINSWFDRTPLELFCGFVTEAGVLTPQQVRERLLALPIARLWRDRGLLAAD